MRQSSHSHFYRVWTKPCHNIATFLIPNLTHGRMVQLSTVKYVDIWIYSKNIAFFYKNIKFLLDFIKNLFFFCKNWRRKKIKNHQNVTFLLDFIIKYCKNLISKLNEKKYKKSLECHLPPGLQKNEFVKKLKSNIWKIHQNAIFLLDGLEFGSNRGFDLTLP